jgi:hypothetical protein
MKKTIKNTYYYPLIAETFADELSLSMEKNGTKDKVHTVTISREAARGVIEAIIATYGSDVLPAGYSKVAPKAVEPTIYGNRKFDDQFTDPSCSGRSGTVRVQLATYDTDRYMNVVFEQSKGDYEGPRFTNTTLSADAAKKMRDMLNRAYPVAVAPTYPATKYEAPKAAPKGNQKYLGNGKHDWQEVAVDGQDTTERLRVPGGYLYRTVKERADAPAMTFVPMPDVVGYAV